MASTKPARIWIGTIPYSSEYDIVSRVNDNSIAYSRGQRELGESGYEHWQLICHFKKPCRLSAIKKIFGSGCHWEPTRSEAAEQYVWKDETYVDGTRFEHGRKPINRNNVPKPNLLNLTNLNSQKIGIKLFWMPNQDGWMRSLETFWCVVTATSGELLQIIYSQLLSNGQYMSSGDVPEVENLTEPGAKPVWMLTQKILGQNFGTATIVRNMLLLTNFEVELISATCSGGLTNIQLSLKSKDQAQSLRRRLFG